MTFRVQMKLIVINLSTIEPLLISMRLTVTIHFPEGGHLKGVELCFKEPFHLGELYLV